MREPPLPISVHTEQTTMTVGYDQPLYVLPFDDRGTFQKNMFGWTGGSLPRSCDGVKGCRLSPMSLPRLSPMSLHRTLKMTGPFEVSARATRIELLCRNCL
jgi:hypothetical protein